MGGNCRRCYAVGCTLWQSHPVVEIGRLALRRGRGHFSCFPGIQCCMFMTENRCLWHKTDKADIEKVTRTKFLFVYLVKMQPCSFTPYHARKHFPEKVLICNILCCTISNLPLSDLDTVYSKPTICIFRYVTLMQYLLVMTNDAYAIQSARSAIQSSSTLLQQIEPCVISECNIMHYNKRCSVCCIVRYWNVTKSELMFRY
jgi:hypothetical protein